MIFERAFNIPKDHTLKQVQVAAKKTGRPSDHWLHEEFDHSGNLVAKYTSWRFTAPRYHFKSNSGFRKYNCFGQIIEESSRLDLKL